MQAAFLPLASLVALSVSPKLEASPLGGLVTAQALSLLLLLYWAHFFSALLRLLAAGAVKQRVFIPLKSLHRCKGALSKKPPLPALGLLTNQRPQKTQAIFFGG